MHPLLTKDVARKAFDRLQARIRSWPGRFRDRHRTTYIDPSQIAEGQLARHFRAFHLPADERAAVLTLADKYLGHEFNIFGRGWQSYSRSEIASPPVSDANRARAETLASAISAKYQRIDWHRDFNSGHAYNPLTSFQAVVKNQPGADVRVPWELARFHHWHVLVRAGAYTAHDSFVREIENQFYDFVSANPPRFGVQWSSPMDVAIRAANWVVAVDIGLALGCDFSASFLRDLRISLLEHVQHVYSHQESSPSDRANHYLANICGLLVVAAYLPNDCTTIFEFALKEWQTEVLRQFLPDGGSFEGSTGYHRLSLEMCLYAAAFAAKSGYEVPSEVLTRLSLAVHFSEVITKQDGLAAQIGDNDSGRFLKLGHEAHPLDHRHLVRTFRTLNGGPATNFEALAIAALTRVDFPAIAPAAPKLSPPINPMAVEPLPFARSCEVVFPAEIEVEELEVHHFLDFGLCVWKAPAFFLSWRCDTGRARKMEGHCHNDAFAIELQVHGHDIVRDPGSFIYYAEPNTRNQYRSLVSHFPSLWLLPLVKESFNNWLFTFTDRLLARHVDGGKLSFGGDLKTPDGDIFRIRGQIHAHALELTGESTKNFKTAPWTPNIKFSPSYGVLESTICVLERFIVARNEKL